MSKFGMFVSLWIHYSWMFLLIPVQKFDHCTLKHVSFQLAMTLWIFWVWLLLSTVKVNAHNTISAVSFMGFDSVLFCLFDLRSLSSTSRFQFCLVVLFPFLIVFFSYFISFFSFSFFQILTFFSSFQVVRLLLFSALISPLLSSSPSSPVGRSPHQIRSHHTVHSQGVHTHASSQLL
jgi:hypothetical protein